eukprot:822766_1
MRQSLSGGEQSRQGTESPHDKQQNISFRNHIQETDGKAIARSKFQHKPIHPPGRYPKQLRKVSTTMMATKRISNNMRQKRHTPIDPEKCLHFGTDLSLYMPSLFIEFTNDVESKPQTAMLERSKNWEKRAREHLKVRQLYNRARRQKDVMRKHPRQPSDFSNFTISYGYCPPIHLIHRTPAVLQPLTDRDYARARAPARGAVTVRLPARMRRRNSSMIREGS